MTQAKRLTYLCAAMIAVSGSALASNDLAPHQNDTCGWLNDPMNNYVYDNNFHNEIISPACWFDRLSVGGRVDVAALYLDQPGGYGLDNDVPGQPYHDGSAITSGLLLNIDAMISPNWYGHLLLSYQRNDNLVKPNLVQNNPHVFYDVNQVVVPAAYISYFNDQMFAHIGYHNLRTGHHDDPFKAAFGVQNAFTLLDENAAEVGYVDIPRGIDASIAVFDDPMIVYRGQYWWDLYQDEMSSWFTGYSHYLSKIKVNQYALDFRFTTMVPSYQIQFQLSMFNDARSAIFNNFAPVKKSFVFMPIYLYATNNNFIPDIWKTPGINFNILSEGRHLSTLISLGMTTGSMYNFFDHWDDQTLGTDPQPATDSRLMYLELNTTQEFTLFDKAWIAGLDLWATPTQSKMVTNSKGSMTASIGRKLSPAVTFSVSYQTTLPHHYGKLYAIYDEAYTSGDLDDEAAVASYAKMNALNDMSKRHHIGSLTATLNF